MNFRMSLTFAVFSSKVYENTRFHKFVKKPKNQILILKNFHFSNIFIEFKQGVFPLYVLKLTNINLKLINANKCIRSWLECYWRSRKWKKTKFWEPRSCARARPLHSSVILVKTMEDFGPVPCSSMAVVLQRDWVDIQKFEKKKKKKASRPSFSPLPPLSFSFSYPSLESSLLGIFTILFPSYITFFPYLTLISYISSLFTH